MSQNIVTALEIQKRDTNRVNVFLDGEYAFSLSLDDAAQLKKGQALTAADIENLRQSDEIVRAVNSAARFLGARPRSEREVRDNLASKEIAPPVIDLAVERLYGLGYLDDRAFAAFWVQDRQTFKPRSAMALRYELQQKGVPAEIIHDVLADFDGDAAAYQAAQSRLNRLRGSTRQVFAQKLSGFLQRRGFRYETVRRVTRQLEAELEADNPDYFAEPDNTADRWSES